MTAGERLRSLAGQAGTAGALLLIIGTGATSGAALVNYSGLATGTAATHFLTDVVVAPDGAGPTLRVTVSQRHVADGTVRAETTNTVSQRHVADGTVRAETTNTVSQRHVADGTVRAETTNTVRPRQGNTSRPRNLH